MLNQKSMDFVMMVELMRVAFEESHPEAQTSKILLLCKLIPGDFILLVPGNSKEKNFVLAMTRALDKDSLIKACKSMLEE